MCDWEIPLATCYHGTLGQLSGNHEVMVTEGLVDSITPAEGQQGSRQLVLNVKQELPA